MEYHYKGQANGKALSIVVKVVYYARLDFWEKTKERVRAPRDDGMGEEFGCLGAGGIGGRSGPVRTAGMGPALVGG